MRPAIPEELAAENKELPQEGMLFVGEKGKILTGFHVDEPQIISGTKMEAPAGAKPKLRGQVQMTTEALPRFVQPAKPANNTPVILWMQTISQKL
jgi:hypothetical protein